MVTAFTDGFERLASDRFTPSQIQECELWTTTNEWSQRGVGDMFQTGQIEMGEERREGGGMNGMNGLISECNVPEEV